MKNNSNDKAFMLISNEMIYNEMKGFHDRYEVDRKDSDDKISKILEQARITNGRITKLEKVGVGYWISCNPYKFAGFLVLMALLLGLEFKEVIMEAIHFIF